MASSTIVSSGAFQTLTLLNGFLNEGSVATPCYRKIGFFVEVRFSVRTTGNALDGTIIATLPVGFRPSTRLLYAGVCSTGIARVDIDEAGNIYKFSGDSSSFLTISVVFGV